MADYIDEDEWFKKRRMDLAGAAGLIAATSFTAGVATACYAHNKNKGADNDGVVAGQSKKGKKTVSLRQRRRK